MTEEKNINHLEEDQAEEPSPISWNPKKFPLFWSGAIIFALFIIFLSNTENLNLKIQELTEKNEELQRNFSGYRIDGSVSYNNFLMTKIVREMTVDANGQQRANEILRQFNNTYYEILREYKNPAIDTTIDNLFTCYSELSALLEDIDNDVDQQESKWNECNALTEKLNDEVLKEMEKRY